MFSVSVQIQATKGVRMSPLDFIRNFFNLSSRNECKAKSIKDFVGIAKKMGCTAVIVQPRKTGRTGTIKDQYVLGFTATAPGRKVTYEEWCFESYDISSVTRNNDWIKLYLIGEQRMKWLQEELIGFVGLIDPDNQPMDATKFDHLHRIAEKYGVSV
jgi:hypothetical protein